MRLHPLPISSSGQILQPNLAGGANPSGAHFTNPGPQFSSIVGGVTGCGGAGGSAAALAGNPGYNIAMKGGFTMRRAGGRRRGASKRVGRKNKKSCKCQNKSLKCRSKRCKCRCHRSRRMMRGGGDLSATAAPFNGGANLPYHQYMGGIPSSPGFSVGSETPLMNSGMANPPPISRYDHCGK